MSNLPLGPWALTLSNTVENPSASGYKTHVSTPPFGTNTVTPASTIRYIPGLLDTRTGTNNGRKVDKPTSASRNIREQKLLSPCLAKFRWTYQGRYVYTTYFLIDQWYGYSNTTVSAFDTLMPTFPSSTAARDKAAMKLIEKLSPALQSLVVAGEFSSTMGTVRRVLNTITGYHNGKVRDLLLNERKYRKKRESHARALADLITDLHLEYNFGLKPLISDLDSALKAAEFIGNGSRRKSKLSAKFVDSSSSTDINTNFNSVGFSARKVLAMNSKVVGKVGCTIKPDCISKPVYESLGLSLRDFVPAVYECFPYSWLLDYVTNVGDFINLLSLHRGMVENGWEVTLVETTRNESLHPTGALNGQPSARLLSSYPGVFEMRRFSFNRKPFNLDTFVPDFRFEVPDCRQAANVAALVVQRLLHPRIRNNPNGARVDELLRRG